MSASLAGADARRIPGELVSSNFFSVLGRAPALGREFSPGECAHADGAPVVILSDASWHAQFHADPHVVGSIVTLNRRAFTVIGIAPDGFGGTSPLPSSFWAPIVMQNTLMPGAALLTDPNTSWLEMVGRLKPGVSLARARADLAVIAGRIDQSYAGRTTTLAVDTALSRAAARQKEIAIRLSAGASRGRLIRQLLTESLLISFIGGALGSVLALWTFESLYHIVMSKLPSDIPPIALNLTPDWRVLGYAIAISVITGILFGLLPALQSTRTPDERDSVSYLIAVARGRRKPAGLSSLENNMIVTEILTAARESAQTGKSVAISAK
jgi:hypothetical protein